MGSQYGVPDPILGPKSEPPWLGNMGDLNCLIRDCPNIPAPGMAHGPPIWDPLLEGYRASSYMGIPYEAVQITPYPSRYLLKRGPK